MNENMQGEIGAAALKLNPESETASVEMNNTSNERSRAFLSSIEQS